MSDDFISTYLTSIDGNRHQVNLHLANAIYWRSFSNSKYLKHATQQSFKVVVNQACITAQSFARKTY